MFFNKGAEEEAEGHVVFRAAMFVINIKKRHRFVNQILFVVAAWCELLEVSWRMYIYFFFLRFGVGVVIEKEARDSGDEGAEDGEKELL